MSSAVDVSSALGGVAKGILAVAAQDWTTAGKSFLEAALTLVPVDQIKCWLDDAGKAQADAIADTAEAAKFP